MNIKHSLKLFFSFLSLSILVLLIWIGSVQATSQADTDDFVITIRTENDRFIIPTTGGGYNYNVDCNNDGTNEATGQTGNYTCIYASSGTYTIRIKDNTGSGTGFPRIYFNHDFYNANKLLSIDQWGTGKWTSMEKAFWGCSNLEGHATDVPDLSNVTNMSFMFSETLFNQNISNWNIANVTDVSYMFQGTPFNQPIGNWNTANVTDMSGMFASANSFNQPIGNWNTANVTSMKSMFSGAYDFNQPIGNWNTVNVTDMSYMFAGFGSFNQPIGNWNTANVTDMGYMFHEDTAFNQNINSWNTGNVTDMHSMFEDTYSFNQPIGNWNTANVTDMSRMFHGAVAFNQSIGNWNTVNVTNMVSMFSSNDVFNQPIGNWNTANVTNMAYMFNEATAFKQNIGDWDVGALTNADKMFAGVTLPSIIYDDLLMGWGTQILQNDVIFDGGNSTYCYGESARTKMINDYNWSITDSGVSCYTKSFVFLPVVVKDGETP